MPLKGGFRSFLITAGQLRRIIPALFSTAEASSNDTHGWSCGWSCGVELRAQPAQHITLYQNNLENTVTPVWTGVIYTDMLICSAKKTKKNPGFQCINVSFWLTISLQRGFVDT